MKRTSGPGISLVALYSITFTIPRIRGGQGLGEEEEEEEEQETSDHPEILRETTGRSVEIWLPVLAPWRASRFGANLNQVCLFHNTKRTSKYINYL